jgi:hypothetical protein
MSHDPFLHNQVALRSLDSNSLLRLHDRANAILRESALQRDRTRADLAARRIARELQRRNVKW